MIYSEIGSILARVQVESGLEPGTLGPESEILPLGHHWSSCSCKLHGIRRSLSPLAVRLLLQLIQYFVNNPAQKCERAHGPSEAGPSVFRYNKLGDILEVPVVSK
ncbi:hypothetical protein AVEN_258539-1 [Araneus ventricosus]|uniref:Uncharacterized protein n=1 Tax=Araneus ventricosus TaxID=182803 RepID=A0A4Y2LZJ4_ARAVE|nr:hypothetical protein AVEN_258539-1 [Araneus ventricosus]